MKLGLLTGVLGDNDRDKAFRYLRSARARRGRARYGRVLLGLARRARRDGRRPEGCRGHAARPRRATSRSARSAATGIRSHPNPAYADRAGTVFRRTVLAAEKLGVRQVVLFAGCPGTPDGGEYPNWVSTGWPGYYEELLEWQWEERIIPFWKEGAAYAGEHDVRLAFEPHPGDCVFNGPTMRRLRDACGHNVGVNFDPSHLWWQGMDPRVVAEELGRAGHALPRPREGHVHRRSRRGARRPARHFGAGEPAAAPGASPRSDTAMTSRSGASSPACCAASGTRAWSASSTRTR